MKNKMRMIVIMLLIFLCVGYASVNTLLKINESISYGINIDDLEIYISSLYIDSVYSNAAISENREQFVISSDNKVVNYSLTNNSKNYDMQATIVCTNSENITISINQEEVIPAQETIEGVLTIENNGSETEEISCILSKTYLEKNQLAIDKKTIVFDAVDGTVDIGYKVIDSMTYEELPTATLQFYSCVGWYDAETNGNKIEETTEIKDYKDQILYAKYERPIAPTITATTTEWSATSVEISISKDGSGIYPIKHYEYYISDNETKPSDYTELTGTTTNTLEISEHGTWYVYYRTVTEDGAISEWSKSVIVKIDTKGPEIIDTEPSTVLEITNSVKFLAQDNDSKVAGYNISSSNTVPTNWIPVNDYVEENTETVYKHDTSWAKVFFHDAKQASVLYADNEEALFVDSDYKYSVLKNLENYRNTSSLFEFLLEYPDYSSSEYNRWIQSANPATEAETIGTGAEFAPRYQAVSISWSALYWGGLLKSTHTGSFIDGSIGHSNWYYAIGAHTKWTTSIPGPTNATAVDEVDLWVRIDDKTRTTKKSLAATIGGITTNGTYYLHVRDSSGNTTYKAFTISNII